MEQDTVICEAYWGELMAEDEEIEDNLEELLKDKQAAIAEEIKLHQLGGKSTKECKPNYSSIQQPLDEHGQNLLLHSIELKHHIRKMMLMRMAAQHQLASGSRNDNLPQLPAPPSPPTKYCAKDGMIYVRPQQRGFLSNPPSADTKNAFSNGRGSNVIELDYDSLKYLKYKAVSAICCHSGYENAHEAALDVLCDVLGDFLRRFSKMMRVSLDAEASQRESRFPNVLEYALQETGVGGLNTLWQYWTTNILEYALKLQQEDQRLITEYEKINSSRETNLQT